MAQVQLMRSSGIKNKWLSAASSGSLPAGVRGQATIAVTPDPFDHKAPPEKVHNVRVVETFVLTARDAVEAAQRCVDGFANRYHSFGPTTSLARYFTANTIPFSLGTVTRTCPRAAFGRISTKSGRSPAGTCSTVSMDQGVERLRAEAEVRRGAARAELDPRVAVPGLSRAVKHPSRFASHPRYRDATRGR